MYVGYQLQFKRKTPEQNAFLAQVW